MKTDRIFGRLGVPNTRRHRVIALSLWMLPLGFLWLTLYLLLVRFWTKRAQSRPDYTYAPVSPETDQWDPAI